MTEERRDEGTVQNTEELSQEELDREASDEELPDREAMSLINANLAPPVHAAVAANISSDNSAASANAEQDVDTDPSQ